MDRVRFGRALGFGARQAVKTLTTAADAAAAPNPAPPSERRGAASGVAVSANIDHGTVGAGPSASRSEPVTPMQAAAMKTARTTAQARDVKQNLRRGTRRFGEAVWRPFVRLSGVLWLEVTGVFFGIFALLAVGYVWKLRGAWRAGTANAADHRSLVGAVVMLALFGYFCVSSFVRARKRERGR